MTEITKNSSRFPLSKNKSDMFLHHANSWRRMSASIIPRTLFRKQNEKNSMHVIQKFPDSLVFPRGAVYTPQGTFGVPAARRFFDRDSRARVLYLCVLGKVWKPRTGELERKTFAPF